MPYAEKFIKCIVCEIVSQIASQKKQNSHLSFVNSVLPLPTALEKEILYFLAAKTRRNLLLSLLISNLH